jgi:hypothetical protein
MRSGFRSGKWKTCSETSGGVPHCGSRWFGTSKKNSMWCLGTLLCRQEGVAAWMPGFQKKATASRSARRRPPAFRQARMADSGKPA